MTLWGCADCSTVYSVGAPACPHCGSTEAFEEGGMPKITRHGGATYGLEAPEVAEVPEAAETPTETHSAPSVDYAALTVLQLREECKGRGLSTGGSKDTLVTRLTEQG